MSNDYCGLEMLALAIYARSYYGLTRMKKDGETGAMIDQIAALFRSVVATLPPRCFVFHVEAGFFKPVADLAGELKVAVGNAVDRRAG